MYLTNRVRLVGIKEMIDCKNARFGKLKKFSDLKADHFLA